jgi:hypothetical protein
MSQGIEAFTGLKQEVDADRQPGRMGRPGANVSRS